MVIFEADVIAYAFVGDSLSPSLENQSWAAGSYGCGSRSPTELSTPVSAFVNQNQPINLSCMYLDYGENWSSEGLENLLGVRWRCYSLVTMTPISQTHFFPHLHYFCN